MAHFVDLHNDFVLKKSSPRAFARYVAKAEKDGVRTIFVSVWTTDLPDPIATVKKYRKIIDELDTKVKLLLHIEDAWFVNEANIDEVIACNVYSVGLVWNQNNPLAGGAFGDSDLTPLGKIIVEKFIKAGVVIDLAHLNKQSFLSTAAVLKKHGKKLLCTHTCFHEVNPHPRNLDREQLQLIVDSGGLVGLTLVPEFLGRGKTVFDHVKYFHDNFGKKNLGMGTDFYGTRLPRGFKNYRQVIKSLEDFPHMLWYEV